jgi:hypothetical protein
MSALIPVAEKLSKLIPRLATNHDGEIVATVAAIGRTLQSAGLDFHDLAAALREEPSPPEVVVPYRDREPDAQPPMGSDWISAACWCRDADDGRLTPWERSFVRSLLDQLRRKPRPSARQARVLNDIFRRLWR